LTSNKYSFFHIQKQWSFHCLKIIISDNFESSDELKVLTVYCLIVKSSLLGIIMHYRLLTEAFELRLPLRQLNVIGQPPPLYICCLNFPDFWAQLHQLSTYSFYVRRAQNRKKRQSSCQYLFTLLGSALVKAVCRMLMKLRLGLLGRQRC